MDSWALALGQEIADMKTLRAFFLLTLLGIQAHADDSEALREVQEKRKAALENAIKLLERDRGLGRCDYDDLVSARIMLNRFYRNHTADPEQKRKFQAKIVELSRLRFLSLQRDLSVGIEGASRLKAMRAEDRFLAAKQKYLQIGAKEKQPAEQGGARQPATAPESKPEGKEHPKPE